MEEKLSPWDLLQPFDAERFGPDVMDRAQQSRWSHAMFIGGLPYMWRLARPVLNLIYDNAEIRTGDRILLFGESLESCGFISDLKTLVGPTGEVRTIDIQEDARNAVAAQQRGLDGKIGTFALDRYTRDIPDEAFDLVLNLQGVQHCEDWSIGGRELLRLMKSGRRLVMAEIVLGSPEQIWKIQADLHIQHLFDKIFSRRTLQLTDYAYYSPAELKRAFAGQLTGIDTLEWRGLEIFWGRKP